MSYVLDKYFDKNTMSIHIKENIPIYSKNWKPWAWKTIKQDKKLTKEEVLKIVQEIQQEAEEKEDCNIESQSSYHKVYQNGPYRIVIVFPPLSDSIEITAVRPVVRLSFQDYKLDTNTKDLLLNKAKWILIAWSPGSGKTTFVQALIDAYIEQKKIVKTIESPRDLQVPNEVVQYSFSYWSHNDIRDILLLSRPDYTAYDEVRNQEDFILFKDLRLTWIWLLGVIHWNKPVDAIQRFVWTIELWVIPQVIDTVIFMKWWNIHEILQLELVVKTPTWMKSDDLARPVIEVKSFFEDKLIYEIYSYWEQVVVIPISKIKQKENSSKLLNFAKAKLEEFLKNKLETDFYVKIENENNITIYVPEWKKWWIIWKAWEKINQLEKELWCSISVKTYDDLPKLNIKVESEYKKKQLYLYFPEWFENKSIKLLIKNKIYNIKTDNKWVARITQKWLIKKIQQNQITFLDL